MTGNDEPVTERKHDRFVIHDGEIEVTGRRAPSEKEKDEADRVLNRILKNRKEKQD